MIVGALIFVFAIVGITDASATLNPFTPFTLKLFQINSHNFDKFQFYHICFAGCYIISYLKCESKTAIGSDSWPCISENICFVKFG